VYFIQWQQAKDAELKEEAKQAQQPQQEQQQPSSLLSRFSQEVSSSIP
jgi:hypothetical protein